MGSKVHHIGHLKLCPKDFYFSIFLTLKGMHLKTIEGFISHTDGN